MWACAHGVKSEILLDTGNALIQGNRTHLVARQRSAQMQNQWRSQNEAEKIMPLPKQIL